MEQPQEPEDMPPEFYSSGSFVFRALWLRGQGREEEAAQIFQEAAGSRNLPGANFGLGISFLNQGKFEEAIAAFEAALQFDPDWASAYDALGRTLDKAGRYDEAIDKFKLGLKLSPNYYAIFIHMGDAYKHKGDMQNAIHSYRNAATGYTETTPDGHICLANALLETGNTSEAIKILGPLIEGFPNLIEVHLSAGDAFFKAGRTEEARARWQRVLAIRDEFDAVGLGSQKKDDFAQQAQSRLNTLT